MRRALDPLVHPLSLRRCEQADARGGDIDMAPGTVRRGDCTALQAPGAKIHVAPPRTKHVRPVFGFKLRYSGANVPSVK